MDRMANEFGCRVDRLKQHVNDHGRVQIFRPEQREFNVRRAVRWVNTNMNEFVAENTDMSDVDFEVMSAGHEECFGQQQNCQFIWERYCDNFS